MEPKAADEAAAGREDHRGVAELGVVAGGRAASEGVADPELVEQARRRSFTAEYKARILAEADACTQPGEVGELLPQGAIRVASDVLAQRSRVGEALRKPSGGLSCTPH